MLIEPERVLWSVLENQRTDRLLLVLLHGHGLAERTAFELRHRLPPDFMVASIRGSLRVRSGYGWCPLDATLTLPQVDAAPHSVLDWTRPQAGIRVVWRPRLLRGSRRRPVPAP